MRRFFVESVDINGASAFISGADARHAETVLRLKPGDQIELIDGTGAVYPARIHSFFSKQVKVDLIGKATRMTESLLRITVAQAFLKDKKMDTLARQLSELGITVWIPFISERSVSRPNPQRLESRQQRWRKIAQESLKQCRRGQALQIEPTVSFEEVLSAGQSSDLKIIFWESEERTLHTLVEAGQSNKVPQSVFLIIGPEGGFTKQEVQRATGCGFQSVSLGPRILKAETAAVAAGALIQYIFGDLG